MNFGVLKQLSLEMYKQIYLGKIDLLRYIIPDLLCLQTKLLQIYEIAQLPPLGTYLKDSYKIK